MILLVEAVTKSFETPAGVIDVLRGIDFSVDAGESVAIVGESGAGKSTLLSLLAGLDVPSSGRVCLRGRDLAELSESELARFRARELGIVFQQFHLMGGLTALENVSLPLELQGEADARDKAREALASVGLDSRADHLPAKLSGGECQRVAIARAIVVEPSLLLADEPSGNLDSRTGAAVMQQLFDLVEQKGTALVLVTHSEKHAAACSRRLRLASGRLAP